VCWALSDDYHANEGGHVRIYRGSSCGTRCLDRLGTDRSAYAHALPRAVLVAQVCGGVDADSGPRGALSALSPAARVDIASGRVTRIAEQLLNPVIGKSLVVYFAKPEQS